MIPNSGLYHCVAQRTPIDERICNLVQTAALERRAVRNALYSPRGVIVLVLVDHAARSCLQGIVLFDIAGGTYKFSTSLLYLNFNVLCERV